MGKRLGNKREWIEFGLSVLMVSSIVFVFVNGLASLIVWIWES